MSNYVPGLLILIFCVFFVTELFINLILNPFRELNERGDHLHAEFHFKPIFPSSHVIPHKIIYLQVDLVDVFFLL
jgi:hypothetical protein